MSYLPLFVAIVLVVLVVAVFAYKKRIDALHRRDNLTALNAASSHIKDFATVMALLIGALWALYTWYAQWRDHLASVAPGLQERVFAKQIYPVGTSRNDGLFIGGCVAIKNAGNKLEYLPLADAPLFVAQVKSESIPVGIDSLPTQASDGSGCKNGRLELDTPKRFVFSRPVIDGRQNIFLGDQIRPGVTEVFHFMVKVTKPGVYAVLFSAKQPEEKEHWDTENGPTEWGACEDKRKEVKQQFRWESPTYFVEVQESAKSGNLGIGVLPSGTTGRVEEEICGSR